MKEPLKRFVDFVNGKRLQVFSHDGKTEPYACIGRGRFTCAYTPVVPSDHVLLFVAHGDLSKDILSHVKGTNRHLPKITYLGNRTYSGVNYDVYHSKRYSVASNEKSRSLMARHPDVMAFNEAHYATSCAKAGNLIKDKRCVEFNTFLLDIVIVPNSLKLALGKLIDSASRWGQYYLFDTLRPENVGIDPVSKDIVLIDPMFNAKLLHESNAALLLEGLTKQISREKTNGKV